MSTRFARFALPAVLLLVGCTSVPDDALLILTDTLPDARVRMDYDVTLEAVDATGDVRWILDDGALPPGLELFAEGRVAGAPERAGRYELMVAAEDDAGDDVVELVIEIPPVALISGFEPFGGYATNPSYDALVPMHETLVAGVDVRVIELPVEWDTSWELLLDEIDWLAPALALGTGMADTDAMRYEVRARNREDYTDNAGEARFGDPVVDGAPDALETGLPVEAMADAVEAAGYATVISSDAGTYLCNHVFYHLTHYELYEADDPPLTGFVHVPPAPYSGSFSVEDIGVAHTIGLEQLRDWLLPEQGARRSDEGHDVAVDTALPPTYLGSLPHTGRGPADRHRFAP